MQHGMLFRKLKHWCSNATVSVRMLPSASVKLSEFSKEEFKKYGPVKK